MQSSWKEIKAVGCSQEEAMVTSFSLSLQLLPVRTEIERLI